MYRGNWGRALISRAVAVAVLSVALAWVAGLLSQAEVEHTSKMTHEELTAYVREGAETSFVERYLTLLLAAVGLVAAVETLAGGVRVLIPSSDGMESTAPYARKEARR